MTGVKRVLTPWSYSFAAAAGGFVFLAGHRGFGDYFTTQLDDAFSRLKKTLAEYGLTLSDLVKVEVRLKDIKNGPEMEKLFRNYFKKDKYPARTGGKSEFVDDDTLFSIDGIACRKEAEMKEIKYIPTPWSYSSAVAAGDYVFLGIHRGFGDDFTAQLDDTFKYLKKTLAEFDLTLADLIKVNVRLKNIEDVRVYEKLFRNYFEEGKFPARMGLTTEFIDDDCLLMIDGIAYRKNK